MTLRPFPGDSQLAIPPTVSVVMAAYNAARNVKAAVQSILLQPLTDFELILVDDGSTDATSTLLTAFAAEDERILVLRNDENIGMAASLNRGLHHARGQYIARHD